MYMFKRRNSTWNWKEILFPFHSQCLENHIYTLTILKNKKDKWGNLKKLICDASQAIQVIQNRKN